MKFKKRNIFFGSNLKYLRSMSGMSQSEVGELIEVGHSAVSNYETGKSTPELSGLLELIEIFNVTSDEMLYHDLTTGMSRAKSENSPHIFQVNSEEIKHLNEKISALTEQMKKHSEIMGDFRTDLFKMQGELNKLKKEKTVKKRTTAK